MNLLRTLRRTMMAGACLGLSVALTSCGASHKTVVRHSPPGATADSTQNEIEPLDPEESLRYARERISLARQALKSGQPDLAIAEVDLASDILATIEIDRERQPGAFKRLVELLRLLEQTRREVTPGQKVIPGEDAPALALIQSLDARSLESLSVDDVQQAITVKKIAETCDITVDCTPAVLRNIRFLTTTARRSMAIWLSRSATYAPMILNVLEEEGLPRDLVFLPTIESGYNPFAISRAQAVGMWQFIDDTARLFGLRVDEWIDERRDPEKSTRAAARYLKMLHERLGDWRLALASYNWGRLNVERAMERARTRNFWDLRVPKDTRDYVPLFMAVAVIARSPETFGFRDVPPGPPWSYDPVSLTTPVHLKVVADCAGTSFETLRNLNPALKWSVTPPSERYVLRLPPGTGQRFVKAFAALPPERRYAWHGYRVKRGETLASIASRYDIPPETLARANGLKPNKKLKAGKRILVPLFIDRSGEAIASVPPPVSPKVAQPAPQPQVRPAAEVQDPPVSRSITYIVRRGDTLSKIARAHGVPVKQLCAWNGISPRQHLYPGRKLTLWQSSRSDEKRQVSRASETRSLRLRRHTVRPGETLYRISRSYGVEVAQLMDWNDLRNAAIHPGDQLEVWTER